MATGRFVGGMPNSYDLSVETDDHLLVPQFGFVVWHVGPC
jgi:hypothetical protein